MQRKVLLIALRLLFMDEWKDVLLAYFLHCGNLDIWLLPS